MKPHTQLGPFIYDFRKRSGLTQSQLAEIVGINSASLSRIERGEINPAFAVVAALIDALSIPWRFVDASMTNVEQENCAQSNEATRKQRTLDILRLLDEMSDGERALYLGMINVFNDRVEKQKVNQ